MDLLCADKTGTLTRNELKVVDAVPFAGFDRPRVLALAALASSETGQDPIDAAILTAAKSDPHTAAERVIRFVPFDPATKRSEAVLVDRNGTERRVVKGAFEVISKLATVPDNARSPVDNLAGLGHRVIAVAYGSADALHLAGLIAISDPPRDDSAKLIGELRELGVRTVMVTGDSAVTAAAIAQKVAIDGEVCSAGLSPSDPSVEHFGIFARVVPELKFKLVQGLQRVGHVVGMCGDGVKVE